MPNGKPPYLANTYTSAIRESLVLPEFFESEAPCEWNAIAYLTQLVQKNPTIPSRSGNKALYDDLELIRNHVVPGTVADSILRQIEISMKTKKAKDLISDFWKSSRFIASSTVQYAAQKHRLRGHMAEEVVDEVESRRLKRQCTGGPSRGHHLDGDDEGDGTEKSNYERMDLSYCSRKVHRHMV
ncbi:uncharacterized protein BYT42DRAFT_136503 [Radiomyces spectabilis]|uniref:uncharacterized protein n=1 Tax=Radiomyces spectabilis TaxID=64574 RepID=UPI00222017F3|nr:uncharacterized protein BYT42DRAFT_136503 [Radiomyces spectabilis]KAI8366616.1 hypothetical protein BYT42DRAFT_136503 [Radiomyces spectabilis]